MRKLPEPCNKPFILGLPDEIFGLRARFSIRPLYDPRS
jgi:hypothetical protein